VNKRKVFWYCAVIGLAVEPILYFVWKDLNSPILERLVFVFWPSFMYTIDFFPNNKLEALLTWCWIGVLNPIIYGAIGLLFAALIRQISKRREMRKNETR